MIDLGDTVFIPDFTLYSLKNEKYLLEIVGFWTPEYLNKKIEKINRANRKDLLIVVNENLNCSRDDFKGNVVYYKSRIKVEEVLSALNGT